MAEPQPIGRSASGSGEGFKSARDRRVRLAFIVGIACRPLAFLVPLATVPIMVRYLGAIGYGRFEAIVAVGSWLSLSNVGLGLSLVNRLSECFANGDDESARVYIGSLMGGLGAVVAVVASCWVASVTPIARLFLGHRASDLSVIRLGLGFAGLLTLLGVYLNVVTPIYSAYQETHKLFIWDAAAKVATLGGLFLVPILDLGLLGAIGATLLIPVLIRGLSLLWLFRFDKPEICPRRGDFTWAVCRHLAQEGALFAVLQSTVILNYEADKAILSIMVGPEAVALYSVSGKVFLAAYAVYIVLLSPLWGAYTEAFIRLDFVWIRARIRMSTFLGVALVLLCGCGLVILRDTGAFGTWVGDPRLIPSIGFAGAMTGAFAVRAFIDARAVALNAAGVLKPQVFLLLLYGSSNVGLSVLLVRVIGPVGVLISTVVTGVATSCWVYPILVHRVFGSARTV